MELKVINTMKKILIVPFLVFSLVGYGQITTTKVSPKAEQIDLTPYDSIL